MKNGRGETGLAREERLQIMLARAELRAVDEFRFNHHMPSRAAAIRELLRHGLAAVGAVLENTGIKSRDYGVLKAPRGLGRNSTRQVSHHSQVRPCRIVSDPDEAHGSLSPTALSIIRRW
jgi:hypothetical protein